jgi:cbb3-type cytochrome oxidase subunit 3
MQRKLSVYLSWFTIFFVSAFILSFISCSSSQKKADHPHADSSPIPEKNRNWQEGLMNRVN